MKIKIKKRTKKKHFLIYFLILIFFAILFIYSITFSAQAADMFLRPLLGEKNTLLLESVYFGLQDKIDRIEYIITGEHPPSFSIIPPSKTTPTQNIDKMDLIHLTASLGLSTLAGEGVWVPIAQNLYPNQTIIARTFLRPDASHPYAIVSLVKMDLKKLGLDTQAGTYYPGGTSGIYGPGAVPRNIQQSNTLLAVFNGGFQKKDGRYGMVVEDKTYVPLRINMPTLLLYKDGSIQFITYSGQALPSNIAAIRQNGPYLIENGTITPYVEQGVDTWGRTVTNSMYTWRSGIGITKEGNLIYAAGNSLIPSTLAKALLKAGAVNAIQLDINPPWVRFILYQSIGNGRYTFSPLLNSMRGGKEYLKRYNKDFFYVYKK